MESGDVSLLLIASLACKDPEFNSQNPQKAKINNTLLNTTFQETMLAKVFKYLNPENYNSNQLSEICPMVQ